MSDATSEPTLSLTKRALHALQVTRSRLEALEQAQKEPIAIIGMGCRFPGEIENPNAFWQMLANGKDLITEGPRWRWDIDCYYDPDYDAPGKIVTRQGAFLDRVQEFDPQFFGIAPREAHSMDPQQRLLLEVCWEALEHAYIVPSTLVGSRTGVFIGICNQDYSALLMSRDHTAIDAYMTTGMAHSVAAGRLSYTFGFQGPCLALDTACSSSLVAVHLACQSLRNRESDVAITGGVNLVLCPETSVNFSKNRMLAPDGRCKTFDARANGFGRGEGCGLIVLKRLSDVVSEPHGQDRVLALIRGSAVNQDGATSGLTAPNGPAQQTVIRDALNNAGLNPDQISYIEAHGTGTALGDPIEMGALHAVFGPDRPPERPLVVGSVKTNMGHLEAAAGISGLMKVVLALQHEEIPPHLHYTTPNPHIPWQEMPIQVSSQSMAWPSGPPTRLAGVSSFGFSGTNAHVVLEQAPSASEAKLDAEPVQITSASTLERPLHLLTLSARSAAGLAAQAARYADRLAEAEHTRLADVCYTANTSRSAFEQRLVVAATDSTDMRTKLERFSAGHTGRLVARGRVRESEAPRLAFLFTGQGSQYPGMGSELYQTQPIFRQTIDACAHILDPLLGRSLTALLFDSNAAELDETAWTQPALFALEYALAQMWLSWGIKPDAVIGHSVGEYVAACLAGVFSLEDGLNLIAERGRLMQALPRNGAMVAVFASQADIDRVDQSSDRLLQADQSVSFAALNGSAETVISGDQSAVEALVARLTEAGIRTQQLSVSHAFHSALMEPMLADYERSVRRVHLSAPRIRLISNVTGTEVSEAVADPTYWCRHIRQPVRFAAGIASLRQHRIRAYIEMGPQPVLLRMVRAEAAEHMQELYGASLRQGQSDWTVLAQSLSALYLGGVPIDWSGFDRPYARQRTRLPSYPFQRKRYWFTQEGERGHAEPQQPGPTSRLVAYLNEGNAESLVQQLEASGELSAEERKLLPKLSQLLIRQHQQPQGEDLDHLCYQLVWQEKARQVQHVQPVDTHGNGGAVEEQAQRETGTWLIFTKREWFELPQHLQEAGGHGILVQLGSAFEQTAMRAWTIDAANEADYQRLLMQVGRDAQIDGMVYVWSEADGLDRIAQNRSQEHLEQVVYLTRAAAGLQAPPPLWFVTQEATSAGHMAPRSPFPSTLWGMARSLFLEYPELKGGAIDMSAAPSPDEKRNLCDELLDAEGEDAIALRDQQRYVARLQAAPPMTLAQPQLRSDGAYLITGGLGVIGLKVARFLAQNGAGQLILMGRRGAAEHARETLDFIERSGARVRVVRADSSDETAVQAIFDQVANSEFTLKGVIHAAGVLIPRSIADLDADCLRQVLAPKVDGAWNLHRLTENLALDFFVAFSSISSVLGTAQQAHYTAANGFLDGLAEYRRRRGLPALSINWGPWQAGGMIDDQNAQRIAESGFAFLAPDTALTIFGRLLRSESTRVAVVDAHWPRLKSLYQVRAKQALLEGLGPAAQTQPANETTHVLDALRDTPSRNQLNFLITYLQECVCEVLQFEDDVLPDPEQGFFDIGMDSLTAVELKSRVEAELMYALPPSVVFDYPNIKTLAGHLLAQLLPADTLEKTSAGAAESVKQAQRVEAQREADQTASQMQVQQLSDRQIAALIDEELAALGDEG